MGSGVGGVTAQPVRGEVQRSPLSSASPSFLQPVASLGRPGEGNAIPHLHALHPSPALSWERKGHPSAGSQAGPPPGHPHLPAEPGFLGRLDPLGLLSTLATWAFLFCDIRLPAAGQSCSLAYQCSGLKEQLPPPPGLGGCQPEAGFRIANLMEEVTQQGKEIIKTALRRLLREAVTLKIHIDKIAEAGTFCAAFITRVDPRCQGGGGPSTCRARSWAWLGDANSWGLAGVGVG